MKQRLGTTLMVLAVSLICCFLFSSFSFGQELPKPGTVIDKSNYKTYQHLFPEEFLPGFENGFDGMYGKPFVITVKESKPCLWPKKFLDLSDKNRGKFNLDNNDMITGGYDYNGLPFPGVTPDDPKFGTKLMWNHGYALDGDDEDRVFLAYARRKGEPIRWTLANPHQVKFHSRLYIDPKPVYKTPENLYKAWCIIYSEPAQVKNFQILFYNYVDPNRDNDSYLYLPQLRRVLRGEAGQTSTPFQGTIDAYDDMYCFSGKVQTFTYKYLGEKKVIVPANYNFSATIGRAMYEKDKTCLPFQGEGWEVKETYMMEIKSKNPKYPQSRKVIYMDKDNLEGYYSLAYDRSGKFWEDLA